MPLNCMRGNGCLPLKLAGCGVRRNAKYRNPGTGHERESCAMGSRRLAGSFYPGHENAWVVLRDGGNNCIFRVTVFDHASDRHIVSWANAELLQCGCARIKESGSLSGGARVHYEERAFEDLGE